MFISAANRRTPATVLAAKASASSSKDCEYRARPPLNRGIWGGRWRVPVVVTGADRNRETEKEKEKERNLITTLFLIVYDLFVCCKVTREWRFIVNTRRVSCFLRAQLLFFYHLFCFQKVPTKFLIRFKLIWIVLLLYDVLGNDQIRIHWCINNTNIDNVHRKYLTVYRQTGSKNI